MPFKAENMVAVHGLTTVLNVNGKVSLDDSKLKTLNSFINITLTRYQPYATP